MILNLASFDIGKAFDCVPRYILFRCHNYNTNITNPKKRIRIQIEENGSEATYAGACMTIISAYGGMLKSLKFVGADCCRTPDIFIK